MGHPMITRGCYRLPTEAEWEYAVRAGTKKAYFFGNDSSVLRKYAWYKKNSGGKTHEVRTRAPNPWGLYDVYGNVWEWMQDGYIRELPGGKDPLVNFWPLRLAFRVARGGGWNVNARYLRSGSVPKSGQYIRHYCSYLCGLLLSRAECIRLVL